jgi:tetratricopeptide (TPR) repeat protein
MTYFKSFTNNRTVGPVNTLLLLLVFFAVVAKAAVNLLQTDAAAAFKTGDYERAATEFKQLVTDNPGDITLLRYLGITLRKLERYNDALMTLEKALTIDPASVAVNYHIAITLYKAGALQNSLEFFSVVASLDSDSKYATLARQYMDTISSQLASGQASTAPKRFGFYGQLVGQYDSNLLAIPDGDLGLNGDSSASQFTGYLSGQYYYINKNGWLGSLDLSGYAAEYGQGRFSNMDIRQWNPGISIQKTTMLGQFPAVNSARYDYLNVALDGQDYSETNALTLKSRLNFSDNTATNFTYRYGSDTFDNKGFDTELSSRDADNHSIDALNTWYLKDRKVELDLGLGFSKSDADGLNFNNEAWRAEVAGRFALPKEWWFDLGASWGNNKYPDLAGPVERKTDVADANLALRRWFNSKYLLQLDGAYHEESSSYSSLSYDRYNIGLKVGYAY